MTKKDVLKICYNHCDLYDIKVKTHSLTHHEISGSTERVAVKLGTELPFKS